MATQRHFLIERSPTPIYDRIVAAVGDSLVQLGQKVTLIEPRRFSDDPAYIQFIDNCAADFFIISNTETRLSAFIPKLDRYLFELTELPVVFLHHDNILSQQRQPGAKLAKISGFHRIRGKSSHYCIEPYFCADLKKIGFPHAEAITHASEFTSIEEAKREYRYDVSFVGHILPVESPEHRIRYVPAIVEETYRKRLCRQDSKVEPDAIRFASSVCNDDIDDLEWISAKYHFIWAINRASVFFRGDVVSQLENFSLDILGGDPAYVNNQSSTRKIQKSGITYHPPTVNYRETMDIYAHSKINLNLTSLQFDDAVVNRVIDIGAAGGFVLTDKKPQLQTLTSVHREISYSTVEELNSKIHYYLSHERERAEIAERFHEDIIENCSYERVMTQLLSGI